MARKWKLKSRWYRPITVAQMCRHDYDPERAAISYARWLAARDGIELPGALPGNHLAPYSGMTRGARWTEAVHFGHVTIAIPHQDYNPEAVTEATEPEGRPADWRATWKLESKWYRPPSLAQLCKPMPRRCYAGQWGNTIP